MDLFGYTPPPSFDQLELAGPSIHVGPKCPTCGKGLVQTESGFRSCPLGHGKLQIPRELRPATVDGILVPYWKT